MNRNVAARIAAMAVIILVAAFPAAASAEVEENPVITYGSFLDSPRGYLGCVRSTSDVYCFMARTIAEGEDAGKVEMVAKAWLGDQPGFVVRQIIPGDSLKSSDPSYTYDPTMTVTADLERIGEVSLTVTTIENRLRGRTTEGCALYRMNYWMEAKADDVAVVFDVDGSVDGAPVSNLNSVCDAFFIGPTSGVWRINSVAVSIGP